LTATILGTCVNAFAPSAALEAHEGLCSPAQNPLDHSALPGCCVDPSTAIPAYSLVTSSSHVNHMIC
jgi:hypothetical protein